MGESSAGEVNESGIVLDLQYDDIPIPRSIDRAIAITIMDCMVMVELGLRGTELQRVYRVRKAQEAIIPRKVSA